MSGALPPRDRTLVSVVVVTIVAVLVVIPMMIVPQPPALTFPVTFVEAPKYAPAIRKCRAGEDG
jgi:hypothetical protein